MVKIEELEALDLLMWLQSGTTVAELCGTNQSTVSRRCQRVLQVFRARLLRHQPEWSLNSDDAALLQLQRLLHQQYRLRCGRDLRLNVPFWSHSTLQPECFPQWLLNPEQGPILCDDPLNLLRNHVIEACLITPTQVPPQAEDLVLFGIYASQIDLYGLRPAAPDRSPELPGRAGCSDLDLLACSRLQLPDFLPRSCRLSSEQRYTGLCQTLGLDPQAAAAEAATLPVAFLTPLMARRCDHSRRLTVSLEWPYRESLAVLRSNAQEPAIQKLVEDLRQVFAAASQRLGETIPLAS